MNKQSNIPLIVNPLFRDLIPPLSTEEHAQLEQNIQANGCLDGIIAWKGIIIDGHNRYEICQKHGLPYDVSEMRFASRDEAKLWILENQLGRRNLTSATRIELALRKVQLEGPTPGIRTRKAIASQAGVSEQTVYKYMKIKKLGDAQLLSKVKNGVKTINAAHKGLEVSTKSVTIMYDITQCPKAYANYKIRTADGYVTSLKKLYGNIADNLHEMEIDDVDIVLKLLKRQLRLMRRSHSLRPALAVRYKAKIN